MVPLVDTGKDKRDRDRFIQMSRKADQHVDGNYLHTVSGFTDYCMKRRDGPQLLTMAILCSLHCFTAPWLAIWNL